MAEETNIAQAIAPEPASPEIDRMQQAGVQFGHNVSRLHPKMKPFVAGIKNNVHVIDLKKTAKELERALKFVASAAKDGKTILFVGTKIQARDLTKQAAIASAMPYVTERWLGGTFTNFETIAKRVQHFKEMESKRARGEFDKHTKKERLLIDKELQSLDAKFSGIKNMAALPDAVLILDLKKDIAAAREARRKGITIIGVVDTNIDPTLADYPIPGNDDAISAISYVLERVKEAITSAKNG